MNIEERVVQALKGLDLIDPKITIFRNRGPRILAEVLSPSFEGMRDGRRQAMIWGKLLDELGDEDSNRVEYVGTFTPREHVELLAKANATSHTI